MTTPLDDDVWEPYDTCTNWTQYQPNDQDSGTWPTWFIQPSLAQVESSTLMRVGL